MKESYPLEKGSTTIPAWVSEYDKSLIEAIQELDTSLKPASVSYIVRISIRSTAHRVLQGMASLKQIRSEATAVPTGSGVRQ
jgi:hypothetical protein